MKQAARQQSIMISVELTQIVGELRFMELALLGLSIDTDDDRTAGDIRGMSLSLGGLRQRLNTLRVVPEHALAGEPLH